jgi:hypothetical protein
MILKLSKDDHTKKYTKLILENYQKIIKNHPYIISSSKKNSYWNKLLVVEDCKIIKNKIKKLSLFLLGNEMSGI